MPNKDTKPRVQCQAVIEDYANGDGYNLVRYMVVPKRRACTRRAANRLGKLCLCVTHTKVALEGLIDEAGNVETKSVIRDVHKYPEKFKGGMHAWARNLKPEPIK